MLPKQLGPSQILMLEMVCVKEFGQDVLKTYINRGENSSNNGYLAVEKQDKNLVGECGMSTKEVNL